MATQTLSNLKINIWNKTGSPTGGDIQLYGGAAGNILFDQTNKNIYVNGSPYSGKDWSTDISGISGDIDKIQNFLTGTTSAIGGTVDVSGVYSIGLTGLATSVNKNVKDYVNTLVTKVTTLETGVSNLQGSTVSSITTDYTGIPELLSSGTGHITLNGNNLLVGTHNTPGSTSTIPENSTISMALHNMDQAIEGLKGGATYSLQQTLDLVDQLRTELDATGAGTSAINTVIDSLRRLKTNSTEYMGVKGANFGGPTGPSIWLQHLNTDIPTNESPISLQSAINNIATVVNKNATMQAYFIENYTNSYINSSSIYFNSLSLDWFNNSYARFDAKLHLKLKFDDSSYSTYIVKGDGIDPAFQIYNLYNIPSAYDIHKHIINMASTYYSDGIPYNITDVTNNWWNSEEYYDSNSRTYLKAKPGVQESIVNDNGKLRLTYSLLYDNIYRRDDEIQTNAYNYVDGKINQVITWTELT